MFWFNCVSAVARSAGASLTPQNIQLMSLLINIHETQLCYHNEANAVAKIYIGALLNWRLNFEIT